MYLWLRSYILEFRYSLHSYSLQRRILLHSCMLFRWFVLLSISSLKIGPVLESKMPWLESVEVLRSELHGAVLTVSFLTVSQSGHVKVTDPVAVLGLLATSQLAIYVQVPEKISHTWDLWERFERWEACVFEVLPIYFMHNFLVTNFAIF